MTVQKVSAAEAAVACAGAENLDGMACMYSRFKPTFLDPENNLLPAPPANGIQQTSQARPYPGFCAQLRAAQIRTRGWPRTPPFCSLCDVDPRNRWPRLGRASRLGGWIVDRGFLKCVCVCVWESWTRGVAMSDQPRSPSAVQHTCAAWPAEPYEAHSVARLGVSAQLVRPSVRASGRAGRVWQHGSLPWSLRGVSRRGSCRAVPLTRRPLPCLGE